MDVTPQPVHRGSKIQSTNYSPFPFLQYIHFLQQQHLSIYLVYLAMLVLERKAGCCSCLIQDMVDA